MHKRILVCFYAPQCIAVFFAGIRWVPTVRPNRASTNLGASHREKYFSGSSERSSCISIHRRALLFHFPTDDFPLNSEKWKWKWKEGRKGQWPRPTFVWDTAPVPTFCKSGAVKIWSHMFRKVWLTKYRYARRWQSDDGTSTVQPPGECFWSGTGDGFVTVSATSGGRMMGSTSRIGFIITIGLNRPLRGMGQTDRVQTERRTAGRTDVSYIA